MVDITLYAKAFISLLVLVNPLEGIPIYLAGTDKADPAMRLAIAKRAALSVTIILLAALFLGKGMLALFSISSGAFQIGGGVILFLIAVNMVLGSGGAPMQPADGKVTLQFAIVPLAIPIMAGPGAINGAVLYGTQAELWPGMIILAGVTILVGIATYASLRLAVPLVRYLKNTGIDIASRIMGLIIAAIAIEMVAQGIAFIFGLKVA